VEFFVDGARVSLEADLIGFLEWSELLPAWQRWSARVGSNRAPNRASRTPDNLREIRERVIARLKSLGYRARIIYRTVQAEFGDESPANLLPSEVESDRMTVYLDFAGTSFSETSIRRVIGFPDTVASSFATLEKTRLHRSKIDLDQIPEHYVFATLSAFFDSIARST
jgi:hypothetical protein